MTVKVGNSSYDKDRVFICSKGIQTTVNITELDDLITQLTELRDKHQQENEVNKWTVADCYQVEKNTVNRLKDGILELHQTITRCFFRNGDEAYELVVSVDRDGSEYNLYNTLTGDLLCDEYEDESNQYYPVFQRLCYLFNEELEWEDSTWF